MQLVVRGCSTVVLIIIDPPLVAFRDFSAQLHQ